MSGERLPIAINRDLGASLQSDVAKTMISRAMVADHTTDQFEISLFGLVGACSAVGALFAAAYGRPSDDAHPIDIAIAILGLAKEASTISREEWDRRAKEASEQLRKAAS
jgi:hypothetical protein